MSTPLADLAEEFVQVHTTACEARKREQEIGHLLVAALPTLHAFCAEHGIPFDPPCGLTHENTRNGGPRGPQPIWKYAGFSDRKVAFNHDCDEHTRWAQDDKEMWVPLVALTNPQEWLFLRALNPDLDVYICS